MPTPPPVGATSQAEDPPRAERGDTAPGAAPALPGPVTRAITPEELRAEAAELGSNTRTTCQAFSYLHAGIGCSVKGEHQVHRTALRGVAWPRTQGADPVPSVAVIEWTTSDPTGGSE